jgi:hypothetical protein
MVKRWFVWAVVAAISAGLGSQPAHAQVTTATIFGVVQDDTQGVIPGATVTVTNVETGVTRSLVTDHEGRYRAPSLALGSYQIQAELAGFKTVLRSGVVLTVGQEAEINFVLGVGELTDTVEVTGEAAQVETTRSQLSDLVDRQQIRDLPLNARSYTDLALLQPGVMTTSRSGEYTGTSGGGVRLSISGARPMNTAYYVDGMDVKDAYGRTPGSAAGTTLGVDTIREFQVLVSSFSAEYGGSGGVVNSVTKSGTNDVHGSAFYFLRHSSLDAPNYFDEGNDPPPFHRHQGGFTLGGPILRNRTFFFGSFERLTEELTTTETINVPGPSLRAGILPTGGTVTIHPTTQMFLNAMPAPNGELFSDGTGEFTTERTRPVEEDYVMAKVDHNLTGTDSLSVRYTRDVADRSNPQPYPNFAANAETHYQYMTAEHNKVISSTLLNTLRFSVNRSRGTTWNSADGIDESLNLVPLPGRVPAQLIVPSIASYGNDAINDRESVLTSFQVGDKLSWTRGRHFLVAGFDITRVHFDSYSASRKHGRLRFSSMANFLRGVPQSWEFLVPGTGELRFFRQHQFAFFGQDDFRIRPNMTVNFGVRWDFVDTPTEKNGEISNLRNFMDQTEVIGDPFFKPERANVAPRVGFVWDPNGDGRTSIRSGFGVFYQPLTYSNWAFAATQQAPYFLRTQINNPSYPPSIDVDPAALPPGNPSPMEFEPSTPYYLQFNVTFQREILANTVVSVSYAGSRGENLASAMNFNVARFETLPDGSKFWPANSPRFNPLYATIELRAFNAESEYNSLQFRFNRRFSENLQVQSSYTYGKNLDHTSETTSAGISDAYDIDRDWGLSDWDVRHNWVLNFTYAFPSPPDGLARTLLGGWQTSGILTVAGGNPETAFVGFDHQRNLNFLASLANNGRPNLKPGADSNPVLGGPDRYYDASSFELQPVGTQGNLARNTLITPEVRTFDLSVVKNISFGQARSLQLRAEFFNLFDRANFGTPNTTVFTNATGTPSPSFGRINSTSTTARQGQIAVKMLF